MYDLKLSSHLLHGLPLGCLPSTSPPHIIFGFSNHLFCLLSTTFKVDSCPSLFWLCHCKPSPFVLSLPLTLDISSSLLIPVTCASAAWYLQDSHLYRSVGTMHALYTFICLKVSAQLLLQYLPTCGFNPSCCSYSMPNFCLLSHHHPALHQSTSPPPLVHPTLGPLHDGEDNYWYWYWNFSI